MEDNMLERLVQTEARSLRNEGRIEDLEDAQKNMNAMVTAVTKLSTEQEHIKTDVGEIKEDVKSLAAMPGKKWEKVSWAVAAAVITALVGYILNHVGI